MDYSLAGKKVYVAGSTGMVGASILRKLADEDCAAFGSTRADVDLTRQDQVEAWFEKTRPDAVFLAAARVGGIMANSTQPASFLYENLMIEANIIEAAHQNGVEKLLFLGSSCIYPKAAKQPYTEDQLMQGPLEPTNEGYAIAKIAGIRMCEYYREQYGSNFISAMPTNLYGTGDNYDLQTGHVLPALVRKIHEAKLAGEDSITIWGSGSPMREFMHADDCADALVFLMKHYAGAEHVNVGTEHEVSIYDLARMIADISGFEGEVKRDTSKPDGSPRKLMDSSRLHGLGWRSTIPLEDGLARTVEEFRALHAAGDL
ncbi:MAG: GDP-L-fucose synthase [Paracoccaceae bacterium]